VAGSERSPDLAGSRARLRGAVARLGCSPAEALALAVLAGGAVAALGLLWLLARPGAAVVQAPQVTDAPTGGVTSAPSGPSELLIHVVGQVVTPGVYRLPPGSRVADALGLAGGPLPDAALESVNLARALVDGEQVLVPGPGQPAPAPGATGGGTDPESGGGRRADGTLDLNLASAEEFEELPGVGPVLAQRILEHRTAIGRFTSVGELRDVTGIGEKTFQALSAEVSV
jgi:competence protein ComEA